MQLISAFQSSQLAVGENVGKPSTSVRESAKNQSFLITILRQKLNLSIVPIAVQSILYFLLRFGFKTSISVIFNFKKKSAIAVYLTSFAKTKLYPVTLLNFDTRVTRYLQQARFFKVCNLCLLDLFFFNFVIGVNHSSRTTKLKWSLAHPIKSHFAILVWAWFIVQLLHVNATTFLHDLLKTLSRA